MAPSSLFLRCLTILSFITNIAAGLTGYQLEEVYSGSNFFDAFNFFTDADPTHGFVTYVSESAASQQGLISVGNNGVYMGVDSQTVLSPNGAGRNSVRIESKKSWTHGLFVADLSHMPGGACGSWPAMWTVGDNWPYNGEIDIIEGVNSQNHNLMSLHTGPTCSVAGTGQSGTLQSANCNNFANPVGVGCGISDTRANSFGAGFNLNNGGIYALEWTSAYIRVYFFPHGTEPADINGPNPDPSGWGTPVSNFEGDCDIDSNFRDNRFIFDTTFCGDWASAVWSSDATCGPKATTCVDYVANNPGAFADQYWLIKSISIYQLGTVATQPSNTPGTGSAPSPSAPVVAQPSPVVPEQGQNPPTPIVTPVTPISPPVGQGPSGANDNPAPQSSSQPGGNPVAPSQPNDNSSPDINSIFDQISDLTGGLGDIGNIEGTGNCNPPPRPLPTYDPEYPDCGNGGKCPLTPAFHCPGNNVDLSNIIPTPPAFPSVSPAGELLGVGSGGIPDFDPEVNAENYFNAAKDELQGQLNGLGGGVVKQVTEDDAGSRTEPGYGIAVKPFYPDEAGNGNDTAGSAASPTPVLGGKSGDSGSIVAFEGGAAEVVSGGLVVWGMVVVIGGLVMM